MTRMILDIKENTDVKILRDIADRLELVYTLEDVTINNIPPEKLSRIMKGVDVSNFGIPSDWQRQTRKDRNLNISGI